MKYLSLSAIILATSLHSSIATELLTVEEPRFDLHIKVLRCADLYIPDERAHSGARLYPYGKLFFQGEEASKSDSYGASQGTEFSMEWGNKFQNQWSDIEVASKLVEIRMYSLFEGRRLYDIGSIPIQLPSLEHLTTFNETQWGSGSDPSAQRTSTLHYNNSTESFGTCDYTVQLRAVHCLPGQWVDRSKGPCQVCIAGNFCPEGRAMWPCHDGEYSNSSGALTCQPCEAGYQCLNGATDARSDQCPPGTFSLDGLGSCFPCEPGYYGSGFQPATSYECDGKCEPGYQCPRGSTNKTAQACDREGLKGANAFCEDGKIKQVKAGYYAVTKTTPRFSTEKAVFISQNVCPTGYHCTEEGKIACGSGMYQDEPGQTRCKDCSCQKDEFSSTCGFSSPGVCTKCNINEDNVAIACPIWKAYIPCDGHKAEDTSRCVSCENMNTTEDAEVRLACENRIISTEQSNVLKKSMSPQLIALVVVVNTLLFSFIVFCVVRKRRQMRRRMAELARSNQSYEDENDIAITMQNNLNPMYQKALRNSNNDGTTAIAKIHAKEMNEIQKHQAALEQELRRLKMETQQQDVMSETTSRFHRGAKKKKEFREVDLSIH